MDSGGDVGLGTASAVVELHIVDGDTPTLRLEQDGSSGFTPQTWDLAGNETNFFIRDVTNGSRLPFRIRPNAPTSSIDIAGSSGDVGFGTTSPSAPLNVVRTAGDNKNMIQMTNDGSQNVTFDDSDGAATDWQFGTSGGNSAVFRISAVGSGGNEVEFRRDGSMIVLNDTGVENMNLTTAGNVTFRGTVTASVKPFKIDHPLDPANKYLYHTAVESPDMANLYNGNVVLDESGEAWVQMPEWFEALNRDFRYQLTAIGGPGPNLYVAEEIRDNRFQIAGGQPGMRVSWQVTGVRHDAYAEAYRTPVEEVKPAQQRGTYLHPELFPQSEDGKIKRAASPETKKVVAKTKEKM